jgi:signal transduction histidine kinase
MRNKKGERPEEESRMLERIAENSALAMEGMNDIVWSVNTRYEKLSDVEDRMLAYAGPIAEAKGWELEIDVEDAIRRLRLNMNERKNVYLIFKEAVNNIAKYAECDHVRITLKRSGQGVELCVQDNGVGLSPGAMDNGTLGGNGLSGMRQRAEAVKGDLDIRPVHEGGTLVTLHFVPHAE